LKQRKELIQFNSPVRLDYLPVISYRSQNSFHQPCKWPNNPLVKKTVLLVLDLQAGLMMQFSDHLILDKAATAIAIARKHGVQIAHIHVALDEAEPLSVPTK
jgi:hypothetical protein